MQTLLIPFIFFFFSALAEEEGNNANCSYYRQRLPNNLALDTTLDRLEDRGVVNPLIEDLESLIDVGRTAFICAMVRKVELKNRRILRDREFALDYIKRLNQGPKSLSTEEQIAMTEIMIRYRILPKNPNKPGRPTYYFSSARYLTPTERDQVIRRNAEEFVRQNGSPKMCIVGKLTSTKCISEILEKIHVIPPAMPVAQAVLESGAGRSDVARNESNFLGLQILFRNPETMPDYKGCRPAHKDPKRCILRFEDDPLFQGSLDFYYGLFNANDYPQYKDFRNARMKLLTDFRQNSCEDAKELARYLGKYAESPHYIQKVNRQIEEVCRIQCDI